MIIEIKNLVKKFNNSEILNINDMIFPDGGFFCLMGENGAGKTTLLRIISGLDNEYGGMVSYDCAGYSREVARRLSFVFQEPVCFHGTVFNNLLYPLILRGYPKAEAKELVDGALTRLDIGRLRDKRGDRLSVGETKKAALARATLFDPAVLLLDEAFAGVDQRSLPVCEEYLRDFWRRTGATVILVTHDRQQAERFTAPEKIIDIHRD